MKTRVIKRTLSDGSYVYDVVFEAKDAENNIVFVVVGAVDARSAEAISDAIRDGGCYAEVDR